MLNLKFNTKILAKIYLTDTNSSDKVDSWAKDQTLYRKRLFTFANAENCRAFMVQLRWPDGVVRCPNCGSDNVSWLPNANVYKCY